MEPFAITEIDRGDRPLLEAVGRLRIAVWSGEGTLSAAMRQAPSWLDEFDAVSRHWIATAADGSLVGAARLTVHPDLETSPDGYLWLRAGRTLPPPVANIAKLVVRADARGRGLASALNRVRIEAAREMGAGVLTVTASAANARLLMATGFVDSGLRVEFENRPGVVFQALELVY